jgi:hypothetical protein
MLPGSSPIAVARSHHSSTAFPDNGGCRGLACPGCVSQDTWIFADDHALPVLLAWCQEVALHGLDGITISECAERGVQLGEVSIAGGAIEKLR